MSDTVILEMEDYLHEQKINYEIRSVHCICTKCGKFALFESHYYGTPVQDYYCCDNPDCDNSHAVSADGDDDWDLNGFDWVV